MSKYRKLWEYIKEQSSNTLKLTYEEIETIAGVPLDHSFLKYKKELLEYGWQVKKKIHMKEKSVEFIKN
ncbi:MAG: hypothetical protein MST12_09735 [Spirochaetia bacterium]|nr:hypothetical protein [Spirochaetia bacterium]MCI7578515.1 hypothetical protein [Spirochaetia bacterium]